ncbi:Uncharacterized protein FWK35_00014399, partial [Aphis craccivora]
LSITSICCIIPSNSHLSKLITYQLFKKSIVDPNSRFILTVFNSLHSDRANDLLECCQLNGFLQYNKNINNFGSISMTNKVLVPIDMYHTAFIASF